MTFRALILSIALPIALVGYLREDPATFYRITAFLPDVTPKAAPY